MPLSLSPCLPLLFISTPQPPPPSLYLRSSLFIHPAVCLLSLVIGGRGRKREAGREDQIVPVLLSLNCWNLTEARRGREGGRCVSMSRVCVCVSVSVAVHECVSPHREKQDAERQRPIVWRRQTAQTHADTMIRRVNTCTITLRRTQVDCFIIPSAHIQRQLVPLVNLIVNKIS